MFFKNVSFETHLDPRGGGGGGLPGEVKKSECVFGREKTVFFNFNEIWVCVAQGEKTPYVETLFKRFSHFFTKKNMKK